MKTKLLLASIATMAATAFASAQIVHIPDQNFKNYLLANAAINTNSDSEIQVSEAEAFTGGITLNPGAVADLTGIEAFVNLTTLSCFYNNLTSLDISNNLNLEYLFCYKNKLTSLVIGNNTKLKNLFCEDNNLTSLDVSDATSLEYLYCQDNDLTSLTGVNNAVSLIDLLCENNNLTNLDVSNSTKLQELNCNKNQLTSLNTNGCTDLQKLVCQFNELTSLGVNHLTKLQQLWCSDNDLAVLDVGYNTELKIVYCDHNPLTSLNIGNKPNLEQIWCRHTPLTSLDVIGAANLEFLTCENNQLTSLDLTNNTKLAYLSCSNNQLTVLDVSKSPNLMSIFCQNNQLAELNLKNGNNVNTSVPNSDFRNNNLTCIQVDDVGYSNANWSGIKDTTACFSESCHPDFASVAPANAIVLCLGETAPTLLNTSDNNISGVWSSATIDTSTPGTQIHTFTPNPGECANLAPVTISVTVNPKPVVTLVADKTTICFGESMTLTASGADTYAWNNGLGNGASHTVTPAVGTHVYKVIGTSTDGCTSEEKDVTITVNAKPVVTLVADKTTICAGESITLTAGGADSYAWNNGLPNGDSHTVTPAVGTHVYKVIGTSADGCTSLEEEITVTVNAKPVVTLNADKTTICAGESVTLTAGGADTYSWNNGLPNGGSHTVSPSTGTHVYKVTGTSTDGCTSLEEETTITVNPKPLVTLNADKKTICAGESVTLTANGSDTYAWNNGLPNGSSHTVSPATGTHVYKVTGTSADGCTSDEKDVTVTVNTKPVVTLVADKTTICVGESMTLTASGANSYAWNNGLPNGSSHTVTPSAGTHVYKVTGTSTDGCTSDEKDVTVTVNAKPVVTLAADKTTICVGESMTLTASGADTYAWNNGLGSGSTKTVTPLAGTHVYKVTGTSTDGCTSLEEEITVTVNAKPVVTLNADKTTICVGESMTLTASGANSYAWNNGLPNGSSHTVTPSAGTHVYKVTGTSTDGCTSDEKDVTVTVNAKPVVTLVSDNNTICFGETVTLTASGATTYTWGNGASHTVTPSIGTHVYKVTGTTNGCASDEKEITITVNAKPVVTLSPDQTICFGESATLTASGSDTYAWDNGLGNGTSHTVSPSAGTHVYKVTGTTNGCASEEAKITITVKPTPIVTLSVDQTTICAGESVTLTANGATTYAWTGDGTSGNGAKQLVTPAVGTHVYKVTGTDANGCTSEEKAVTVVVNPKITPKFDPIGPVGYGEGFTLPATSTNGVSGSWSPAVDDTRTREYTFTPDVGQCANDVKMAVVVTTGSGSGSGSNIPIQAVDDAFAITWTREWMATESVLDNDSFAGGHADLTKVLLKPLDSPGQGIRMNTDGTISIAPHVRPGRYTYRYRICEVAKPGNCSSAVATIEVRLHGDGLLFAPNVFTPNGDGENDTFEILGIDNFDRIALTVVSHQGDQVYRSENYRNQWDGRGLIGGTYYYVITAYKGDRTERIRGWVLLKR